MTPEAAREAASAFAAAEIAPGAAERERQRAPLDRAVYRRFAETGLAFLQVPRAQGGPGAPFAARLAVAETLAGTCFASAFALNNIQSPALLLARIGAPEQVARHLPGLLTAERIAAPAISEPGAGSDAGALTTRARPIPDGWWLDGEKAWVTNGVHADLLIVYAQTRPGGGADGIASFLVETGAEGMRRGEPERLAGGGAIGAAPFTLQRVILPMADMLAPPGRAFRLAMRSITSARVLVAAMVNGMVAACLGRAVQYGGSRVAFGRTLLEHQGLRWSLAEVATRLEASRLLTARAGAAIERGDGAVLEASQAKAFAAELGVPAITACQQAVGAAGLRDAEVFGRHLAGARIAAFVDGTTEMQRERVGALLGAAYGTVPPGAVSP